MNERAEFFGSNHSIFGILTEPEPCASPAGKPAILLLNAGLMHHIGPFRMYVVMARTLAQIGFTVLRFDLSSKGDSPPRPGNVSYKESVRTDVAEALQFLQQSRGFQRFVLVGLCSGAGDAFDCAVGDSRISGAVLLDGYAYRTRGFYMRHYLPRILNPSKWQGFIARLLKRAKASEAGVPQEDLYGMAFPDKAEFQLGLEAMLARGAAICIVHTGGWFEYFNDANQFREAFPELARDPRISVHYFRKADHTYTIASDRKALIAVVCNWAASHFASAQDEERLAGSQPVLQRHR